MNKIRNLIKEININYSTTRRLIKSDLHKMAQMVTASNKPQDKFETQLLLLSGENRQGEGGLRTKGYFKVGGIIPSSLTHNPSNGENSSPEEKPLITIVTVVYNGEKFLEETILSVINQTYDNIEYIIIDGGSTDGTLDIIKKYEHAIDYWVSEKDNGIYDAMNKGIDLATGEWINFMNAGDSFAENNTLKNIYNIYNYENINLIFGDTIMLKNGVIIDYKKFNEKKGLFIHQSVFYRKKLHNKYGKYIVNKYFTASDYYFISNCIIYEKLLYHNIFISKYDTGGLSNNPKTLYQKVFFDYISGRFSYWYLLFVLAFYPIYSRMKKIIK